ncbi:hypothetical protein COLO4_28110 [Corchorus olitorius]|uniref:TF-B3 domain-containing protein n=1 Tax=Corchorus olitorius TaxID=93759 RepID=A0A1R3HMV1_9ROSI|nr:hypothetical protein COLO4_28110 [Corchorus olitorius]
MSAFSTGSDVPVFSISDGSDHIHVDAHASDNLSGVSSRVSSHFLNALDSFYISFNPTSANLERLTLVLPSKALPFFNTNLPADTVIVDRHESTTAVKLCLIDGQIVITDGWHEFLVSHNLQPRDLCFSVSDDQSMFVKIHCLCRTEVVDFPSRGVHNNCVDNINNDFSIGVVERSSPSVNGQARKRCALVVVNLCRFWFAFADPDTPRDAQQFRSSYPSFARCLTSRSDLGKELHIPSNLRSVLPRGCTIVKLNVVGGHTSTVLCYNNEGGLLFSHGWRLFVVANDLTLMDSCVFEITRHKNISVHIFRFSMCNEY